MAREQALKVGGTTMERAQEWVKVMSALSADENPLLDETGELAEFGDMGDVHYLAGTFNIGIPTVREFDVDYGDTLVLPMLNSWSEEFTNTLPDLREDVLSFFESANVSEVHLRIDLHDDGKYEYGKPGQVLDVSEATYFPEVEFKGNSKKAEKFFINPDEDDKFTFDFPEDGIYQPPTYPEGGGSSESYTTGYYAEIGNLPEGTHRLEYGGTFTDADGNLQQIDITNIITVVDDDPLVCV